MDSIAAMRAITRLTAYQSFCYSASGFVGNCLNLFWLSRPPITRYQCIRSVDIMDMIIDGFFVQNG